MVLSVSPDEFGRSDDALARIRGLIGRGDPLLALDAADDPVLSDLDPAGRLRLGYLRALALARVGAVERATAQLVEFDAAEIADSALSEDIAALSARLVKDQALHRLGADRLAGFAVAADRYEAVYHLHRRPFSGINAASMRLLAGATDRARELAAATEALLDESGEQDYWAFATRAEAALIRGDLAAVTRWLVEADAAAPDDFGARASTLTQLRLLCEATATPPGLLGPLANPDVVHYCGHMIAAPGEPGRFVADDEFRVREAVRAALASRRSVYAYGSLAAGADIIVAEEALRAGLELFVALPFDRDEFVKTSVRPSGEHWVARFGRCIDAASRVQVTCDSAYLGDDALYGYASKVAMGQALNRAHSLASTAWQLAIWDSIPTDHPAGTAHDIAVWRRAGAHTTVIEVGGRPATATAANDHSPPDRTSPDPSAAADTDVVIRRRPIRALLFGDVRGFSGLRDQHLDRFIEHVLGSIATVLDCHDAAIIDRNTWGDGLFVAFTDPLAAARCALDLQALLAMLDTAALGLPAEMRMRISVHAGPVLARADPVRGLTTVFGRELTRAARIEPLTPPGEVYATSAFAALLRLDPDADVTPEYVGVVTTAKSFETIPMYVLRRDAG